MKKLTALSLVFLLLMAWMPSSVLATDQELAPIILSVKDRLEISGDFSEFTSDVYGDTAGKRYTLTWATQPDDMGEVDSIYVSVNDQQEILSYRKQVPYVHEDPRLPKFNQDAITDLAYAWLTKVNPHWIPQLPREAVLDGGYGNIQSPQTTLVLSRRVNDLAFCQDQVMIRINNQTGEILSMDATWHSFQEIPLPEEAIPSADAAVLFLKQSPLSLRYLSVGEADTALVYMPADRGFTLNARTGEPFVPYGAVNRVPATGGVMQESAADKSENGLTPQEIASIQTIEGLLDEADLRKRAESLKYTEVTDAEFVSCAYEKRSYNQDGQEDTYIASLRYRKVDQQQEIQKNRFFYITMNAKDGALLSYSAGQTYSNEEKAPKLSQKQAIQVAQDFLDTYFPVSKGKINLEEASLQGNQYYIDSSRYEYDIPYPDNYVNITIDHQTGKIQSFSQYWNERRNFTAPDKVLPLADAEAALMDKVGLELSYGLAQKGNELLPVAELQYNLDTTIPAIIDAKTGQVLDYDGFAYSPEERNIKLPEDCETHYAQKEITALFRAGILQLEKDSTAFRPNDAITQKELLAFVLGLKSGFVPYNETGEAILKMGKSYGIVPDGFIPEATATREVGTQFLISALGYDAPAKLSSIYQTGFLDEDQITPALLGYVALAKGFAIVSGDPEQFFHPQAPLTRGDAAIMIYRYLAR